ncbi:hypothetical protein C8J57DRAFT_148460 [Mycena rebaudengoi]|nr:hypothetical protein C8J57DRAFT_148460 [Mycena rebaudengoi]
MPTVRCLLPFVLFTGLLYRILLSLSFLLVLPFLILLFSSPSLLSCFLLLAYILKSSLAILRARTPLVSPLPVRPSRLSAWPERRVRHALRLPPPPAARASLLLQYHAEHDLLSHYPPSRTPDTMRRGTATIFALTACTCIGIFIIAYVGFYAR